MDRMRTRQACLGGAVLADASDGGEDAEHWDMYPECDGIDQEIETQRTCCMEFEQNVTILV